MRTVLNILNFVLGTALPLRWHGCWRRWSVLCLFLPAVDPLLLEITKLLSLFPYGNEAIHVDELNPAAKAY